jgi:F0F1-type ATP synthase delta subunit
VGETGDYRTVLGELNDFVAAYRASAELRDLLETPALTMAEKSRVLEAVAARLAASPITLNFLRVLAANYRMTMLDQVVAAYRRISNARLGIVEVKIFSATDLSETEQNVLTARFGELTRASTVFGQFTDDGSYASSPSGTSEIDLEQDVFASLRVLRRGQVSLLVPFVETRRRFPSAGAELGGGIGDVNASARYELFLAGRDRWIPGVAALAGVTLPTGTPADSAHKPLATDATGVGAVQANLGLAIEQLFGPWLVNATVLVAQRAARSVKPVASAPEIHERLGTQVTAIAGAAYAFPGDAALAAFVTYTIEGDATINGADAAGTGRRVFLVSGSGVLPLDDHWRIQGSLAGAPPLSSFGRNQPATAAITWTLVRSWM